MDVSALRSQFFLVPWFYSQTHQVSSELGGLFINLFTHSFVYVLISLFCRSVKGSSVFSVL